MGSTHRVCLLYEVAGLKILVGADSNFVRWPSLVYREKSEVDSSKRLRLGQGLSIQQISHN